MGLSRRAYGLLRGYVNYHWDRVHDLDDVAAREELNQALQNGAAPVHADASPVPAKDTASQEELARKILGVEPDASFELVRKAYERLRKRSDPNRFPESSEERSVAEALHSRVETAYRILAKDVPSIEKRFGNLEID